MQFFHLPSNQFLSFSIIFFHLLTFSFLSYQNANFFLFLPIPILLMLLQYFLSNIQTITLLCNFLQPFFFQFLFSQLRKVVLSNQLALTPYGTLNLRQQQPHFICLLLDFQLLKKRFNTLPIVHIKKKNIYILKNAQAYVF